jgi:multimeric flavodoxin WrbA
MESSWSRRRFIRSGGGVGVATLGMAAGAASGPAPLKILGVSCSPRKGKTTAAALNICLEEARKTAPEKIEIELIELADLEIPAYLAAGVPLKPGHKDDFPQLAARLADSCLAGLIVGTPVYFGSVSALCKAFLDRCISLRKKRSVLANKVAGALAVAGSPTGGQELAIQCIHAALFRHEVLIVGDGQPTCHTGATLRNNGKDDITQDAYGIGTAKSLGRRVAEMVLSLGRQKGE